MRFKSLFFVVLLGAILAGCMSKVNMEPVPIGNQTITYQMGTGLLTSETKKTIVAVQATQPNRDSGERPKFILSFYNKSKQRFNIDQHDIKVMFDGKRAKTYSYQELVDEVEFTKRKKLILGAMAAILRGINASNSGVIQTNTDYYSMGQPIGSSTSQTYNPYMKSLAEGAAFDRSQRQANQVKAQAAAAVVQLSNTILRKTTVMPKTWAGGYIIAQAVNEPEQLHDIELIVRVNGETHAFKFRQHQI